MTRKEKIKKVLLTILTVVGVIAGIISAYMNVQQSRQLSKNEMTIRFLRTQVRDGTIRWLDATKEINRLRSNMQQREEETMFEIAEKARYRQLWRDEKKEADKHRELYLKYKKQYEEVVVFLDFDDNEHLQFFIEWSKP